MDWAELDDDLLQVISKKLGDFLSFSCFRGVCKNWRLATDACDHPPSLPWFFQYKPNNSTTRKFFSLQSNRTHTFNIAETNVKYMLLGPSNRYLFTLDFCNLTASFLNPLIGNHIHVPMISPIDHVNLRSLVVINPDPAENGHVAIICKKAVQEKTVMLVAFMRFDGTILTKMVKVPFDGTIAYYKGRLFSSVKEITRVIDVDNGNEVMALPEPGYGFTYLVQAFGDLFGVAREFGVRDYEFEAYRLAGDGKNPHWAKMNYGIGDLMLFLDMWGGFGLKASDYDGYKGNCIYFLRSNCIDNSLARYDIASHTVQVLPFFVDFCGGSWFVPYLY